MVEREVPVNGIIILLAVVAVVVYVAYRWIDNPTFQAIAVIVPIFFAASALLGLKKEYSIADEIVKEGLVDEYVEEHGLGNRETFNEFIEDLEIEGYTINPGTKSQLQKEIMKRYEEIEDENSRSEK